MKNKHIEQLVHRTPLSDIIGMSYYPFWHGTMEQLRDNMNDISARYDKDVLIAETAFPFTTEQIASDTMIFTKEHVDTVPYRIDPQGQRDYMVSLMETIREVKGGRGLGFFYWEPTWANLALLFRRDSRSSAFGPTAILLLQPG